jgi:hypothetical protein
MTVSVHAEANNSHHHSWELLAIQHAQNARFKRLALHLKIESNRIELKVLKIIFKDVHCQKHKNGAII